MSVSLTTLRQFNFFRILSDEDLLAISFETKFVKIKEKNILIKSGTTVQSLIFIVSGELQLTEFSDDGRITGVEIQGPGDMINHLLLIVNQPINYNVTSNLNSDLILLPISIAKRYIYSRPLLAEYLLNILNKEIQILKEERAMLSQPNAFHRVFMQLNQFAVKHTKVTSQTISLPNQKEIASMVNTSRETVSRALQILIKNGILTKSGHQILINKKDLLEKIAVDGLDALDFIKNNSGKIN